MYRARKIQKFLSQPFTAAEVFTGMQGKFVPLEENINGFKAILNGEYDQYNEQAFFMVGGIAEVKAKAEKMASELKGATADAPGATTEKKAGLTWDDVRVLPPPPPPPPPRGADAGRVRRRCLCAPRSCAPSRRRR